MFVLHMEWLWLDVSFSSILEMETRIRDKDGTNLPLSDTLFMHILLIRNNKYVDSHQKVNYQLKMWLHEYIICMEIN